MKFLKLLAFFSILISLQMNVVASDDFVSDQRKDFDTIAPENIEAKREDILSMAKQTLERLYKEQPGVKEEINNAYGYGVFEGHVGNFVLYVAGKGFGVVFDNKTQSPVYMNAVRAGTGPGVGYKSVHAVVIFDNETVYKQFTTIGLQASASGDAVIKVAGKEAGGAKAASLVPGVSMYQLIDSGLVLQANWGATEFIKDANLNK